MEDYHILCPVDAVERSKTYYVFSCNTIICTCTRKIKYQVCFLVFFPSGGKRNTLFFRFFYLCLCFHLLRREISPKASVRNAIFNVILKGKKVSTSKAVK